MMATRSTPKTSRESHPGQFASKDDTGEGKLWKHSQMMTSSSVSPIQRGISRPLGKSSKNTKREVCPRKPKRLKGKAKTGKASANTKVGSPDEGVILNITRKKAA